VRYVDYPETVGEVSFQVEYFNGCEYSKVIARAPDEEIYTLGTPDLEFGLDETNFRSNNSKCPVELETDLAELAEAV